MKLVWSRRALADLAEIATYYSTNASPTIAKSIEDRFLVVLDRIRRLPEAAPRVSQRSSVHVVAVVRYPIHSGYFIVSARILSTSCTSATPAGVPSFQPNWNKGDPIPPGSRREGHAGTAPTPRSSRRRWNSWSR
ncbi:type II toxin-antitoxin system RelE/ParE family toxin [Bradyrhizobium cenepequi]